MAEAEENENFIMNGEHLINWRCNRRPHAQHPSSSSSLSNPLSFRFWGAISVFLFLICPILFLFITHFTTTFAFPASGFLLKMSQPTGAPQRVLRVMTFNIWLSGERVSRGLEKIAQQIIAADPDIVAVQELQTAEVGKNLTILLGETKWSLIHHAYAQYPDTAIITKHKFVSEAIGVQFKRNIADFLFHEELYANHSTVTYGTGVSIELDNGQRVNMFSMHLDYKSYGPYAADNKLVNSENQIMAGERNKHGYGRAQNMEQLIASDAFKQFMELSGTQPFIVAGDFNCPSHLDWIEETKHLHGGWAFEWPATKLLMDTGFLDSYRQIHPKVLEDPGITWSTVQKTIGPDWDWTIPEPQDRIDFIFYRPNPLFRPIRSFAFAGEGQPPKPIPDQWENEWPSDHYAVITEFTLDLLMRDANDENGAETTNVVQQPAIENSVPNNENSYRQT